jgi:hypothetical protein
METIVTPFGEWTAAELRPVAHWERRPDETGRSRLVMVWTVPDADEAFRRVTAVSA